MHPVHVYHAKMLCCTSESWTEHQICLPTKNAVWSPKITHAHWLVSTLSHSPHWLTGSKMPTTVLAVQWRYSLFLNAQLSTVYWQHSVRTWYLSCETTLRQSSLASQCQELWQHQTRLEATLVERMCSWLGVFINQSHHNYDAAVR